MSKMIFLSMIERAVLLASLLCVAVGAWGEEDVTVTLGKMEFAKRCAACHGADGRGDGPLADLLVRAPLDLTQISQRNGSKFPVLDVYQAIDGRRGLRAHGTSEMPLWGDYYNRTATQEVRVPHDVNHEEIVHGRILALVYYLQTMQVE